MGRKFYKMLKLKPGLLKEVRRMKIKWLKRKKTAVPEGQVQEQAVIKIKPGMLLVLKSR